MKRILLTSLLVGTFAVTACTGGDKPQEQSDSHVMDSVSAVWRARKVSADSLVRAAPEVAEVVKDLGAKLYDVAEPDIESAVKKESEKTSDCYTRVRREVDPGLAVVLYVLVNYGAAGWDLKRVERWNGTSDAVNMVVTCINGRAPNEWKLPEGPKVKSGAHLVRISYTPADSAKGR